MNERNAREAEKRKYVMVRERPTVEALMDRPRGFTRRDEVGDERAAEEIVAAHGGSAVAAFDDLRATPDAQVGATELLHRRTVVSSAGAVTAQPPRPIGVMRWSMDDTIIREVWPAAPAAAPAAASDWVRLPLVTEGVPDAAVLRFIALRCPAASARGDVLFATPLDFCAVVSRSVLLPRRDAQLGGFLSDFKTPIENGGAVVTLPPIARGRGGTAQIIVGRPEPLLSAASPSSTLPIGSLEALPDLRYSAVLRGCECAPHDLIAGLEQVAAHGFINYAPVARHGFHIARAYRAGHRLLRREFGQFLATHVNGLAEGSRRRRLQVQEIASTLLSACGASSAWRATGERPSSRHIEREWERMSTSLEAAQAEDAAIFDAPRTGLYAEHVAALLDVLKRTGPLAAAGRGHADQAAMVRAAVGRGVVQDALRTLADVHFNAYASLRLRSLGPRVVVGDVVCADRARRFDTAEAHADHVTGFAEDAAFPRWEHLLRPTLDDDDAAVRIVRSEAEAAQYTLADVLLPKLGRGDGDAAAVPRWPEHRVGRDAFDSLARELGVAALAEMKLAPYATYRRLVVNPSSGGGLRWACEDHARGLFWGDAALRLTADTENMLRQRVPDGHLAAAVARPGIRGNDVRRELLQPVQRGLTVSLDVTLPRGAPLSSLLREACRLSTLSPATVYGFLRSKPTWRR